MSQFAPVRHDVSKRPRPNARTRYRERDLERERERQLEYERSHSRPHHQERPHHHDRSYAHNQSYDRSRPEGRPHDRQYSHHTHHRSRSDARTNDRSYTYTERHERSRSDTHHQERPYPHGQHDRSNEHSQERPHPRGELQRSYERPFPRVEHERAHERPHLRAEHERTHERSHSRSDLDRAHERSHSRAEHDRAHERSHSRAEHDRSRERSESRVQQERSHERAHQRGPHHERSQEHAKAQADQDRSNERPHARAEHQHSHERAHSRSRQHGSSSSRRGSKRERKKTKCKDGSLTREQKERIEASRGEPTYVLGGNGRFRENIPGLDIDVPIYGNVDITSSVEQAIAQLRAGMSNAMNSNLCDGDNVLINRQYFVKQAEQEKKRKEQAVKDGEARANVSAHDFYSQLFSTASTTAPARPRTTACPPTDVPINTRPINPTTTLINTRSQANANGPQTTSSTKNTTTTKPPTNPRTSTANASSILSTGNCSNPNLQPAPTISKPWNAGPPSIESILARGPARASRNSASALSALKRMSRPNPPASAFKPVPPLGFKRMSLDPRRLARLKALSAPAAKSRPTATSNLNSVSRLQLTTPRAGGQSTFRVTPISKPSSAKPTVKSGVTIASGSASSVAGSRNEPRPPITIGRNTITNPSARNNRPNPPPLPSLRSNVSSVPSSKDSTTTIDLTGDDSSDEDEVEVVNNPVPKPKPALAPSVRPPNFRSAQLPKHARLIERAVRQPPSTKTAKRRKRASTDAVLLAVPVPRKKSKPSGD